MKFFYSWKVLSIKAESWGGDYGIPFSREKILNCSAGTDFILGLYGKFKTFPPGICVNFFTLFWRFSSWARFKLLFSSAWLITWEKLVPEKLYLSSTKEESCLAGKKNFLATCSIEIMMSAKQYQNPRETRQNFSPANRDHVITAWVINHPHFTDVLHKCFPLKLFWHPFWTIWGVYTTALFFLIFLTNKNIRINGIKNKKMRVNI